MYFTILGTLHDVVLEEPPSPCLTIFVLFAPVTSSNNVDPPPEYSQTRDMEIYTILRMNYFSIYCSFCFDSHVYLGDSDPTSPPIPVLSSSGWSPPSSEAKTPFTSYQT